jgi:hypothetical protein
VVWESLTQIGSPSIITLPKDYHGYGYVFVEALLDAQPVMTNQRQDFREGRENVVLTITDVSGTSQFDGEPYTVHPKNRSTLVVIDDYQPIESKFVPKDDCNCSCTNCNHGGKTKTEPAQGQGAANTVKKIAPNIALNYSGDRSSTQRFDIKTFTPYFPVGEEPELVEATLSIFTTAVETLYFDYQAAAGGGDPIEAISEKIGATLQARLGDVLSGTGAYNWSVEFRYGSNVGGTFAKKTLAGTSNEIVDTINGVAFYVDREHSQFGNGWGIHGVDKLHAIEFNDPQIAGLKKGLLLAGGDGDDYFYEEYRDDQQEVAYRHPWGDTLFRRIERASDPDIAVDPPPWATYSTGTIGIVNGVRFPTGTGRMTRPTCGWQPAAAPTALSRATAARSSRSTI